MTDSKNQKYHDLLLGYTHVVPNPIDLHSSVKREINC